MMFFYVLGREVLQEQGGFLPTNNSTLKKIKLGDLGLKHFLFFFLHLLLQKMERLFVNSNQKDLFEIQARKSAVSGIFSKCSRTLTP